MPNCYQCTVTTVYHDPQAIGVCVRCSNLACAGHGGRIWGAYPQFKCSGCVAGICTKSSGGPPPGGGGPGSPPPQGGSPGGSPHSGGIPDDGRSQSPDNDAATFSDTVDFEMQLPVLARASLRQRRQIRPDALRETIHRLFLLLHDGSARDSFLDVAAAEVRAPVYQYVNRQLQDSDALFEVFEERGGADGLAEQAITNISNRIRRWFAVDLAAWMAEIHAPVQETVWLGEPHRGQGAINLLLLADAIGLYTYTWDLEPGESPFRRIEVVGGTDIGMLVLAELYARSMPLATGGIG